VGNFNKHIWGHSRLWRTFGEDIIGIEPKLVVGAARRRSDLHGHQRFHQKCARANSPERRHIHPTGAVERFGWTVEGKMMSHTHADGATERWSYDGEGSPVEHIDVLGNVSRIETTHFDFPSSETRPDGSRLAFEYDTEMNLVAVTNTQGEVWRYTYDPAGRVIEETDFNGRTSCYERNAAGEMTASVNGAGERIGYVRNLLGDIVERRSAGGVIATYEVDQLSRIHGQSRYSYSWPQMRKSVIWRQVSDGRSLTPCGSG
jgi:YD repeat-containing protein